MTNAAVQINNLTTSFLSLDAEIAPRRNIRSRLAPIGQTGASVDVGDIASLSELNTNAQIAALLGSSPPKISITVARGTTDVPGADVTSVIDTSGMGAANPRLIVTILAGAGGARDVSIYTANFPFAARLVDQQIMVNTAIAGTVTLRDAVAGGGNALSAANSTAAAVRVRDPGTGQTAGAGVVVTLAKNSSLVARMTAGDAALTYIMDFIRLS